MKLFRTKDKGLLVYADSTIQAAKLAKVDPADLVKINDPFVVQMHRTTSGQTRAPVAPLSDPASKGA